MMRAGSPLRLGLLGVGVVGGAVLQSIRARFSDVFQVSAVSVRNPAKARGVDLGDIPVMTDPLAVVGRDDVDVVVELIGGAEGVAHAAVLTALEAGKAVVTANKALLATHGGALSELAQARRVPLLFEAAVCGGMPVIKLVREGLAGNRITRLGGILNGTCNYILSTMDRTGQSFETVLRAAQDKGYAEADPALDIDGYDTAHKLAILVSLATHTPPDLSHVAVTGIRHITHDIIARARGQGYTIKLLGVWDPQGARVAPHLVSRDHPVGMLGDALNALVYTGDMVGDGLMTGRGAGGASTASAVLADLLDLAAGRGDQTFGLGPFALGVGFISQGGQNLRFDEALGLPIWG